VGAGGRAGRPSGGARPRRVEPAGRRHVVNLVVVGFDSCSS
jgi:hypothetical protein